MATGSLFLLPSSAPPFASPLPKMSGCLLNSFAAFASMALFGGTFHMAPACYPQWSRATGPVSKTVGGRSCCAPTPHGLAPSCAWTLAWGLHIFCSVSGVVSNKHRVPTASLCGRWGTQTRRDHGRAHGHGWWGASSPAAFQELLEQLGINWHGICPSRHTNSTE